LLKFIHDPQALIAAKDPTALAAQKDFAGMEMPAFPDLTVAQRETLLAYIAQQSGAAAAAPSEPSEIQVSTDPQVIASGKRIFMGERHLARGGGACISCHTARGIEGLGGGRLGPDLSLAYERLGKAKGITGWLGATPTPVMAVTYKSHPLTADEIAALTSFFQNASLAGAANDTGRYKFLGMAAAFTILSFVLIGGAGRNRLRGVRERLTKRGQQ
jgi:mono/diheme cytochrome c family protein